MLTILCGDALDKLRELPDESVQCCVTSPPFWGLRDYGHNGQLGLEKTPEEYVAKMVEVFRGVRRVLRKDGTLWLNLGSSYYSEGPRGSGGKTTKQITNAGSFFDDTQPSQSRSDALACGSDGIEPPDSQNADRAYPDSCDESLGATSSHSLGNVHSDQSGEQVERPLLQKDRDSERSDSVSTSPDVSLRGVRESKPRASFRRDRAACVPSAKASASHSELRSSSPDALSSDDNSCLNNPIFSQKFKPKDLVPIPWMVAMALQADGWWLRSDIIWAKPNPMPESVTDRPTKSHEYLFLLTKSAKYYYDAEAIKESNAPDMIWRSEQGHTRGGNGKVDASRNDFNTLRGEQSKAITNLGRNKRSVWTVATAPYPEAHFATYPPDLIKPCIMAGARVGDTVLDPFTGSGTTGMVALELGRKAVLIELNPAYVKLIEQRCNVTMGLPLA